MHQLLPAPPDSSVDLAQLYAWPAGRTWMRLNVVASVDGSIQGADGRSGSLSFPADRRLFRLLRSSCDVVLVAAGTARAERYRPVRTDEVDAGLRPGPAPVPAIAVVSRSLELAPELVVGGAARTLVLTTASAPVERREQLAEVADVAVVGEDRAEPAAVRRALEERGFRRILVEGGPVLTGDLLAGGQLDELCLTLRATMVGGSGVRLVHAPPIVPAAALELASVLADGADLFLRYPITRSRS